MTKRKESNHDVKKALAILETVSQALPEKDDKPPTKLQKICKHYMLLMAACNTNTEIRDCLEHNPRQLLEEFVGLKIPKEAIVKLDPYGTLWPVANFGKDEEDVMFKERQKFVIKTKYKENGTTKGVVEQEIKGRDHDCSCPLTLEIPYERGECKTMTIVLGYFHMMSDVLAEYKFKGDSEAEVVLSSC
jgi:hypothetical protein